LLLGHGRGDIVPFLKGAGLFGAILAAVALAALSWHAGGRVYRRSFIHSGEGKRGGANVNAWSYRYAFLSAVAALATPLVALAMLGDVPASALLAASLFTTLVVTLVVGLAAAGALVGAAPFRSPWPKVGFASLGGIHGLAQAATGIVLARAGLGLAAGYVAFVAIYGYLVGRRLVRAHSGDGHSRGPLANAAPVIAGWLVALGLLAIPFAYGDDSLPSSGWPLAGRLAIAAIAGGALAPVWLGWYLASSWKAGGHYYEVAGAARVENGKAIVRVRVRRDVLTVYVIGLDQVADDIRSLQPRLVDRFDVRPDP
jgi:hypothetical protein